MLPPSTPVVSRPKLPPAPRAMQQRLDHHGLTWIDFMYPNSEQIEFLRKNYNFHPLHLEDVLSRIQRPKLDRNDEDGYLFIVLHFPIFNEMVRLPTASEVDIFVGPDFVITAHDGRLRPLTRLVQSAGQEEHIRDRVMSRGSGYLLYQIIEALGNYCFPMVYRLDEKLDKLEEDIFKENVLENVRELSYLRRDIISMRRIIRPNIPVLRSLAAMDLEHLRLDEDAYFDNLVDGLSKIWDMLEEHKEIIEGLDATLGSLSSHRINQETKIFTLISLIFLPMTLLASILGMNVMIPFAEHPIALPVIVGLMIAGAGALIVYFRRRGWV